MDTGLAIVHGIVESNGGFITCDSRVGGGTVFKINLPVVEQQDLPKVRPRESSPFGTESILFIDDEESVAEMNRNKLERLGYKVTVRTSSLEALNTFKNRPDDFDLDRRMMQIRPKVPIILCTGYSSLISEEKAKAQGIKGFALKPLSISSISKIIREVLDEGKAGGQTTAVGVTQRLSILANPAIRLPGAADHDDRQSGTCQKPDKGR